MITTTVPTVDTVNQTYGLMLQETCGVITADGRTKKMKIAKAGRKYRIKGKKYVAISSMKSCCEKCAFADNASMCQEAPDCVDDYHDVIFVEDTDDN